MSQDVEVLLGELGRPPGPCGDLLAYSWDIARGS